MRSLPDIDALRALASAPRLHPNGFITLDLDREHKLHVWTETPIRARTEVARIHDHIFAFESTILVGALTDVRYHIEPDAAGTHQIWLAPCKAARCHTQVLDGSGLMSDGPARYRVRCTTEVRYDAGETYDVSSETFHDTLAKGFTVTLMRITDFGTAPAARVLYPKGISPAPFNREPADDRERGLIWAAIERACREAD